MPLKQIGKARLQQEREEKAVCALKEARRRANAATTTSMGVLESNIKHGTPQGGLRVDTLQRLFEEDTISGLKINLDAEDSQSSASSGCAKRSRSKGSEKTSGRRSQAHREAPPRL